MRRIAIKFAVLLAVTLADDAAMAETVAVCPTGTGTGWLERTAPGGLVLHLEGSYYDMGVQHGSLLREQVQQAPTVLESFLKKKAPFLPVSWSVWLLDTLIFQRAEPYIPREYLEEMRGIADASGVSLRHIRAAHAIAYVSSCETAAAWGPATLEGRLFFIRSNDDFAVPNPSSDTPFSDLRMVMVYKPNEETPYALVNMPGMTGASDGMNSEGIAVGNMSLPSKSETAAGIPMQFRIKQTLAKSRSLAEAVEWMTKRPFEGGYNFLVADAKIPDARVIEMNAKKVYVGGWDGPAESNRYTFKGKTYSYQPAAGLLMRANHPLSSELLEDFTGRIEANGQNYQTGLRYADLRGRLMKLYGSLTLASMYGQLRESYFQMNYGSAATGGATTWQVAFDPLSGDFLLAISKGDPMIIGRPKASAFSQPYQSYNLFDLINSEP